MALNAYQKLSWVLPGKPFGDGRNGDLTVSSPATQTPVAVGGSGTSGTKTFSIGSNPGFADGDIVLIHQSRGANAGKWEFNRIVSGGAGTTLTLLQNLQINYVNGGNDQAQIMKVFMYDNITINSQYSVHDWNQDVGGIMLLVGRETIDINAKLDGDGSTGTTSILTDQQGGGFYGGRWDQAGNNGRCGEGTTGAQAHQTSANGNGGGGGHFDSGLFSRSSGGGGGNSGSGGNGQSNNGGSGYGRGGNSAGNAELTEMVFGGGGGGAGVENGANGGAGGSGGAIIIIIGRDIDWTGGDVSLEGGKGGNDGSNHGGGGGGAGGSLLVQCQTLVAGTNKATALKGNGANTSDQDGGDGSDGRIAVHYSGTVTGTTNPTMNSVLDGSLIEGQAGFLQLMI